MGTRVKLNGNRNIYKIRGWGGHVREREGGLGERREERFKGEDMERGRKIRFLRERPWGE